MNKDTIISETENLKFKTNIKNADLKNYKNDISYSGVFEDVEIAINKAITAQKEFSLYYTKEQKEKIITEIRKATLKNKKILLVDDVMTTGATTFCCAEELIKGEANCIIILTAAKSKI